MNVDEILKCANAEEEWVGRFREKVIGCLSFDYCVLLTVWSLP